MKSLLSTNTVTIALERTTFEGHCDTTATFIWSEGSALETYVIPVNEQVSIEFDKHLPVRPATIHITGQVACLEGEASPRADHDISLMRTLRNGNSPGIFAVQTRIDPANRLALAQLQIDSSETPQLLREACQAIVGDTQASPTLSY